MDLDQAARAVDGPTIALLFAFMVISAQLRLGGFYLLIVGSIANIIVVETAGKHGVTIDWRLHARTGVPITLATLAVAAAWLALCGAKF